MAGVALAPDGNFAAYVLSEREGNSRWVQQVGTASSIRVLPPGNSEFWGLAFSPDGAYLYYSLFHSDRADVDLFRLPSLGGMPQTIADISAPGFAISPDGTRIAHTTSHAAAGKTFLQVARADGSHQRRVAKRQQPSNFEIRGQVISWSADGETLAAVVNHDAKNLHYSAIVGINVADGAERALSDERWYNVSGLQWLEDGSGLVMVASDHPDMLNQLWFLPYPSGAARRITNDLSRYGWLGVASDSRTVLTVQTHAVSSVWLGPAANGVSGVREIVSEIGPLSPFGWLSDGRIVFRSRAGGRSNLWLMNADGSGRRQLTSDAQATDRGLCTSPDGRYVVFVSWRAGQQNLWRMDVNESLTQLTTGAGEAYPSCSPDGRWVVYQSGIGVGKPTVWRVALTGGPPQPLVETLGTKPVISNDGQRVAYFYMDEDKWRIGVIPAAGGEVLLRLDVPVAVTERVLRWSPDDDALYYVSTVGDVGNVRALPLDGAPPRRVTGFSSHLLNDFMLSADGTQLAFTRGIARRNVVLLGDLQ